MSTLPPAPSLAGPRAVAPGLPVAGATGAGAAPAGTFAALVAAAITGGPALPGQAPVLTAPAVPARTGTAGGAPAEGDDPTGGTPALPDPTSYAATLGGWAGAALPGAPLPVPAPGTALPAPAAGPSGDPVPPGAAPPPGLLTGGGADPAGTLAAPADGAGAPAAPGPGPTPAAAPGTPGGPAALAPVQPLGTTGPGPTSAGTPVAPAPVVDQVLPEVVRLVGSASTPTTRRVTLQLAPEALGEVRVVLSVRDGAVQVSLAAGQEAQRALLEGTPELRRLLEATGAGDARIVVRDLATPPTTPAAAAGTTGQPDVHSDLPQPGDQAGREWGSPEDQHAGTRGGSRAKDGTHDGTPAGARPNESVTDAPAGIDVTV